MKNTLLTLKSLLKAAPQSSLFLILRSFQTPYEKLGAYLPMKGPILDLGCGHGLFSFVLARQSDQRNVLGVDHDATRISRIAEASKELSNLNFKQASFEEFFKINDHKFDGISLIDSLHYLNLEDQKKVLKNSFNSLNPGGVFLMREVDNSQGSSSKINHLHEKIATRIGFTKGRDGLFFRSQPEWVAVLKEVGFLVETKPSQSLIFADVLFVCRKMLS